MRTRLGRGRHPFAMFRGAPSCQIKNQRCRVCPGMARSVEYDSHARDAMQKSVAFRHQRKAPANLSAFPSAGIRCLFRRAGKFVASRFRPLPQVPAAISKRYGNSTVRLELRGGDQSAGMSIGLRRQERIGRQVFLSGLIDELQREMMVLIPL